MVPLVVSTDKVKDQPFRTMIVRRAMDLLDRECAFQDLLDEPELVQTVNYEGRETTRFAPIQPLFRGLGSFPSTDRAYFDAWESFLVAFQLWYNEHVAHHAEPLSMYRFAPVVARGSSEPTVMAFAKEGVVRQYCPLRVALDHTPHSARASFITARSGLLPVEIVADLVGHSNVDTTIYYTVESEKEVGERILAASQMIWEPDPSNPAHIRADDVNSRLRTAFAKDRDATEKAYGFRTLGLLADERPDGDGISMLRTTPMAQIAFRETHICPVGETCPTDILKNIVEPRRCGLCPLAVKSVDHLPAIGAKMRYLLEQLQESGELLALMKKRGEPIATRTELLERRKIDLTEYEGWKAAAQSLVKALEELQEGELPNLQVAMPEAVERHLRHVSRDAEASEFILARLVDSQTYARLETPAIRAHAARLRQQLLASTDLIEQEADALVDDPVASALAGVRVSLEARGLKGSYEAALGVVSAQHRLVGSTRKLPAPDDRAA